jgi:hypothetical protein
MNATHTLMLTFAGLVRVTNFPWVKEMLDPIIHRESAGRIRRLSMQVLQGLYLWLLTIERVGKRFARVF